MLDDPGVCLLVDGEDIRPSPVEGTVVEIPLFTDGFIHGREVNIAVSFREGFVTPEV